MTPSAASDIEATVGVFYAHIFLGHGWRRARDGRTVLGFRAGGRSHGRDVSARDLVRERYWFVRDRLFRDHDGFGRAVSRQPSRSTIRHHRNPRRLHDVLLL